MENFLDKVLVECVANTQQKINQEFWSNIKMLRLVTFCCIITCLAMFSGCKMCASHTDITGSPVANAMSGDGYRAGSHFGGYSSGGYYLDGYQTTANPQRVFDNEFSRPAAGTKTIQTPPNSSSRYVTSSPGVVPANYNSVPGTASRY